MGIWRCSKCNTVQGGINKPLVGSCPKGGGHRWNSNDNTKPITYRCGKCGTVTSAFSRPVDRRCSKGGNCSWRKYQ